MSFSGRALAAVGILPNAAAGAGVLGDLELAERWHAALGLVWLPEVDTDDGSFAFGLSAATLAGCFDALKLASAELATCAGIAAGAIHAVVRTLEPVEPGDYLWLAATAAPRLRVRPAGMLLVEIGGELAIPLIAHDFVVRGRPGSAFDAPAVGAIGFVGIGAILP